MFVLLWPNYPWIHLFSCSIMNSVPAYLLQWLTSNLCLASELLSFKEANNTEPQLAIYIKFCQEVSRDQQVVDFYLMFVCVKTDVQIHGCSNQNKQQEVVWTPEIYIRLQFDTSSEGFSWRVSFIFKMRYTLCKNKINSVILKMTSDSYAGKILGHNRKSSLLCNFNRG